MMGADHTLSKAIEQKNSVESILLTKKNNVQQKQHELQQAEELLNLESDIHNNEAKLLWIDVYKTDEEILSKQVIINKCTKDLETSKLQYTEFESNLIQNESTENVKNNIEAITIEIQGINGDYEDKKRVYNERQSFVGRLNRAITNAETEKGGISKRINAVRREVRLYLIYSHIRVPLLCHILPRILHSPLFELPHNSDSCLNIHIQIRDLQTKAMEVSEGQEKEIMVKLNDVNRCVIIIILIILINYSPLLLLTVMTLLTRRIISSSCVYIYLS